MSPSGKAEAFDASMRRFESYHPSQFKMNNRVIFTGSSNPQLALKVAENLDAKLGAIQVGTFSDGEINVEINENVRGKDTKRNQKSKAWGGDGAGQEMSMPFPTRLHRCW